MAQIPIPRPAEIEVLAGDKQVTVTIKTTYKADSVIVPLQQAVAAKQTALTAATAAHAAAVAGAALTPPTFTATQVTAALSAKDDAEDELETAQNALAAAEESASVAADFKKPVIVYHDPLLNKTKHISVPLVSAAEAASPEGVDLVAGTVTDGTSVVIPNLLNKKPYYFTYYQKGLGVVTPSASFDRSLPARPHGAPSAPVISQKTLGANNAGIHTGLVLNIKFDDKDQSRPQLGDDEDLIDTLYIYYAREQHGEPPVDEEDLTVNIHRIDDPVILHGIRVSGEFTMPVEVVLAADAKYNFTVVTESDELKSEDSNSIEVITTEMPENILAFSIGDDAETSNEIGYSITVRSASLLAGDYYEIYRENLNNLDNNLLNTTDLGSARTLVKKLTSADFTGAEENFGPAPFIAAKVVGETIQVMNGQVIRLIAIPFSKNDIKGAEISKKALSEEVTFNMLEINLLPVNTVKDGEGNATITFQSSHKASEVPSYESRYIDLIKLKNDKYNLSIKKDVPLDGKLSLNNNGYLEVPVFMSLKEDEDETDEHQFTLEEDGFKGVRVAHHIVLLPAMDAEETLIEDDVDSKVFPPFAFKQEKPSRPEFLMTPAFPTSIKLVWSVVGVTEKNKPTSYVVGLVKNAEHDDFNIDEVTHDKKIITDGKEYCEFINLERLENGTQTPNVYSVYIYAENDAGKSSVLRVSIGALPAESFPANYIENFSVSVGDMVEDDLNTRKCKGTITINKNLWGGAFQKLVLGREDDFGNPMTVTGLAKTDFLPADLKGGANNVFTFDFTLDKDEYNLTIGPVTVARLSNATTGLKPLGGQDQPYKLYASVDVAMPPTIVEIKYFIDTQLKTTLYEAKIETGGADILSVSVLAIPDNKSGNMVGTSSSRSQIIYELEKVVTLTNGQEVFKGVVPYVVKLSGLNGTDLLIVNNRIGQALGGLLCEDGVNDTLSTAA
jgi:hypothetical protein